MKIIGLAIALTLTQCTVSKATPTHVILRLLTRQSISGLDQCQTPCSPIMNFIGTGQESCTPQACCTSTFEQDYLDCFTCVGKARNQTDYTTDQNRLDGFTAWCDAEGISVPKLTFPGQNPNRALPSLSLVTLPSSTNSPGSTTAGAQTTASVLPSTKASNSGEKIVGNRVVLHLGWLFISSIMMQGL